MWGGGGRDRRRRKKKQKKLYIYLTRNPIIRLYSIYSIYNTRVLVRVLYGGRPPPKKSNDEETTKVLSFKKKYLAGF